MLTRRDLLRSSLVFPLLSCVPVLSSHFTMAFVLVHRPSETIDTLVATLETIKTQFATTFHYATLGLAAMETETPVHVITAPSFIDVPLELFVAQICASFYSQAVDSFDFVSFFLTFPSYEGNDFHLHAKNNIRGVGLPEFDRTSAFFSNRLLGINVLHSFHYIESTNLALSLGMQNALLHETGHQWGVYVGENFQAHGNSTLLEIKQQNSHFYRGLQSPYPQGTPMNSDNWQQQENGLYARNNTEGIQRYHPFQLYFMGLLNEHNFDFTQQFPVYDTGGADTLKPWNFDAATLFAHRSIADIINAEGERN